MRYAIKIDPADNNKVVSLRIFKLKLPTDHQEITKELYDSILEVLETNSYVTYNSTTGVFAPYTAANNAVAAIINRANKVAQFVNIKNTIELRGALGEAVPQRETDRFDTLLAELSPPP